MTATLTKPARRNKLDRFGVSAEWRKLFALIPGYDPCATAGPGDYFDEEEALRWIGFIETCCHKIDGDGGLLVLTPFQKAKIGCFFGWKGPNGYRRYRKSFWYEPRGNGKTPILAACALGLLHIDNERGAEIYEIASKAEQAAKMHRFTVGMTKANDLLFERSKIFEATGNRRINLKDDEASFIRTIPCDAGEHGSIPHAYIPDEIHEWEGTSAEEAWGAITSGFAKATRNQPACIMASTADFFRESICNRELKYAKAVRDNGGDPAKPGHDRTYLPVIFETPTDANWLDEDVWRSVNPNLGVTVTLEGLRNLANQAKFDPVLQNTFKRFHLNMQTEKLEALFDMSHWDQCGNSVDESALQGRTCYAGLDLGERDDLASYALLFPPDDANTGEWRCLWRTFCCDETIRRRQAMAVPYQVWSDSGELTKTSGNDVDFGVIKNSIVADSKRFNISVVAYDPRLATQLTKQLFDEHGIQVEAIRQGYEALTEATRMFIGAVNTHKFNHGGNKLVRWCASNTIGEGNLSDHIRPVKGKSKDKIDPIVAADMAFAVAIRNPAPAAAGVMWL